MEKIENIRCGLAPKSETQPLKDVNCPDKIRDLGFCYVGESMLTISGRPKKNDIKKYYKDMKGITMIITCQKEKEKPEQIAGWCADNNMKHFHIDMPGPSELMRDGVFQSAKSSENLRNKAREVFDHLINNNERALLHCAAG